MTSLAVPFAIVLLLTAAILHLMGKRLVSCWLLVLFAAVPTVAVLIDLAYGVKRFGQASYNGDLRALPWLLVFLAVSVLAALRSRWRWLFWLVWLASALLCSVAVYLTYFWKAFS